MKAQIIVIREIRQTQEINITYVSHILYVSISLSIFLKWKQSGGYLREREGAEGVDKREWWGVRMSKLQDIHVWKHHYYKILVNNANKKD